MDLFERFLIRLDLAELYARKIDNDRLVGLVQGYRAEIMNGRPFPVVTDCSREEL